MNNDAYEVFDKAEQKIINLPIMLRDQIEAGRICNVLEHLVRFKMTMNLHNETPSASFQDTSDIRMTSRADVFRPGD
ncbi:hypothetical protein LTR22_028388 [Elasticomyces elasticus]|nr:hypothetical protein LTR22_028388 [Elasticomyces elasticus]KAK4889492.1 hypothetical protein LTR49_028787 [Elasticomyces elasticus]